MAVKRYFWFKNTLEEKINTTTPTGVFSSAERTHKVVVYSEHIDYFAASQLRKGEWTEIRKEDLPKEFKLVLLLLGVD